MYQWCVFTTLLNTSPCIICFYGENAGGNTWVPLCIALKGALHIKLIVFSYMQCWLCILSHYGSVVVDSNGAAVSDDLKLQWAFWKGFTVFYNCLQTKIKNYHTVSETILWRSKTHVQICTTVSTISASQTFCKTAYSDLQITTNIFTL